jgi:hypothetical protein
MDKKRRTRGTAQPRRQWAVLCSALAALALPGCSAPAVEGYQLQAPPEGFLYVMDQGSSANVIPGRRAESGGVWMGDFTMDEPRTMVSLKRYRGAVTEAEAAAAREARAAVVKGSPYNRLGPLRTLPLSDGHTASAWTEERHDEYGRFRSLQVTAVASYDTVAFTLELDTSVPERMREPQLDSILASFGLGVTAVNWVAVAAACAAAGLLLAFLVRGSQRRRPTDYRMARIPKPKGPDDKPLVGGPPGA